VGNIAKTVQIAEDGTAPLPLDPNLTELIRTGVLKPQTARR